MKHAYSLMTIKSMDDDKRRFVGMATTPSVDRQGDIIEPEGMEITIPTPLLWQHSSREPIGWIRAARVSKDGVEVTCEVAGVAEPVSLKEHLDSCWQMLKIGLVRGLSVGFKELEYSRIGDTYHYRYTKTLLLELSCVTIPANGNCSIEAIKSADQAARRAAFGAQAGSRVVRLDPPAVKAAAPGVSGIVQPRRKGVVYL